MKHSRKLVRISLVLMLCTSLVMPAVAATKADTADTINTLQDQASDYETKLAQMKADRNDIASYIKGLDGMIEEILVSLDTVTDEIEQTNEDIAAAKEAHREAEKNMKVQYDALMARIKAIYESSGDNTFLHVLLGDADLASLFNSQEYNTRVNIYDMELYASLEESRQEIVDSEQALGEKQESLRDSRKNYEDQKTSLEQALSDREDELASVDADIRAAYSDISSIQSKIDAQNTRMEEIAAAESDNASAKDKNKTTVSQESNTVVSDQTGQKEDVKETETVKETESETDAKENEPAGGSTPVSGGSWTGAVLTKSAGVVYGPTGKETYYNLDMSGVVRIMRNMGFSAEEYPYWVREDGVKMLGAYVMCAANLSSYPRGTTVACSLGTALVCDTGGFAASNSNQLDIATSW